MERNKLRREREKLIKIHNEQSLNSPNVGWVKLFISSILVRYCRKAYPPISKVGLGFHPNKTAAFTLSEVMLVIGIIGIVAALTLSQLYQRTNNKELVSAFLKSNNILANAYKEAKVIDNIQKMGVEDFKQTFKKHLKIYDCEEHDICLQDGMFVDFTCDEEKCTELTVDTNGDKRPNKKGKDWFKFYITQDRIIPQGESEQCSGYDCGMYTLTYHKIFDGLIDNCKTYKAGQCETCDDGFHLSNNKCDAIEMECEKFEGETCKKCNPDYLLTDNDCIYKDTLNCDVKSETKEECSQCKDTFQNNNGVCEEGEIENCEVYDGLECDTCSSVAYKNTEGNCPLLPQYCADANSDGTCNSCIDGEYITTSASSCVPGYMKDGVRVFNFTYDDNGTQKSMYISESFGVVAYTSAYSACAAKGMHLPTMAELRIIDRAVDNNPHLVSSSTRWIFSQDYYGYLNGRAHYWARCFNGGCGVSGESPNARGAEHIMSNHNSCYLYCVK